MGFSMVILGETQLSHLFCDFWQSPKDCSFVVYDSHPIAVSYRKLYGHDKDRCRPMWRQAIAVSYGG